MYLFHHELYYSRFPIFRILIIRIFYYLNNWTSPCFRQQQEKHVLIAGVLLQEKAKLLYEQLFPDATIPFSDSTRFTSQLQQVGPFWASITLT